MGRRIGDDGVLPADVEGDRCTRHGDKAFGMVGDVDTDLPLGVGERDFLRNLC